VQRAESQGIELWDLSDADLGEISPYLNPSVRSVLSVDGSLNSRNAFGGTAPARVTEQLSALDSMIAQERKRWVIA
jgi:argininosuccinate lyase